MTVTGRVPEGTSGIVVLPDGSSSAVTPGAFTLTSAA
jgi:hypothetical protein